MIEKKYEFKENSIDKLENDITSKRLKISRVSLTHPDYTFLSRVNEFLYNITNEVYFDRVLDFGAGNSPYKFFFNCGKYTTADIQQNEQNTIDDIIEKKKPLPYHDNEFDLILCMDVLEHTDNISEILNDLKRVLSTNGKLVISLPFLYREHEMPFDYVRFTSSGIKNLLDKEGFNNIEITKSGNYFFTAFSLWNEAKIYNGEHCRLRFIEKFNRKLVKYTILPILNLTLFKNEPKQDDAVYHHLLVSCSK